MGDRIGFTDAASKELFGLRALRSAHDPGAVARDLCVTIADGGDRVSDLGALGGQEDLFGKVASESMARRAIGAIGKGGLKATRAARAKARARAWGQGARPKELILDIDATLLTAHSEEQDAVVLEFALEQIPEPDTRPRDPHPGRQGRGNAFPHR